MESTLPPCEFRIDTPQSGTAFCRHSGIVAANSLVPLAACRVCSVRLIHCNSPRDIPTKENVRELLKHRSEMPGLVTQGWNLVRAIRDFVADGCKTVSTEDYQSRLQVCESCERCQEDRCLACGCNLMFKARGRAFECPLNLWPKHDP